MILAYLVTGVLLAIAFGGWLVFAWHHWRFGGVEARFWTPSKVSAVVVVLALFVASTQVIGPLHLWLDADTARRKLMTAVWAVYGLPLWGLGVVLFPAAARDLLWWRVDAMSPPAAAFSVVGWLLIAVAWLVLGLFSLA